MSAPTPAPGDDRPREGYYPDPSIPGYVRYWNGAAWVPGTSRPAPEDGETLAPPPGSWPGQAPGPAPGPPPGLPSGPPSGPPSVEETGPHFFDEDPPQGGPAEPASAWGADRAQQSGFGGEQDRRVSWGADPRLPADSPAHPDGRAARTDGTATIPPAGQAPGDLDPGGTFVFRRPTAGSAGPADDGTMTFRPVSPNGPAPGQGTGGASGGPGTGPGTAGSRPGFGAQGPVRAGSGGPKAGGAASSGAASGASGTASGAPSGPGFGAGKAAAARAAAAQAQGQGQAWVPGQASAPPQGSVPGHGQVQVPGQAQGDAGRAQAGPLSPGPGAPAAASVPPQASAPPAGAGAPMSSGPGGGQSSWAQQVHRLAGPGDEPPVAPWKPPVEDPFQAMARKQAAARPAGIGKRLAARLVDTLVLGAVTAAAAVPLGAKAVDHVQEKIDAAKLSGRTVTVWLLDGTTGACLGIVLGVLLLTGVLYEVLPTAKWGRTLGKKLCGLQVRDIEAHEPPTVALALRRWLVYSVPGLLGIGVVGVLWCLFDRPWHQCWHDKAAHTFVAG
ncbi:RDD family protein [Streptomyces sp. NPDC004542]|uniref:RDD family protein n=1 Tax=Streptomyces sp. NPDC004542 TaxID=3154281 RepID=UPI0033BC5F20